MTKCKHCKYLTGVQLGSRIECMNPILQKKWNLNKTLWKGNERRDTARYKTINNKACQHFEPKEEQ